MELIAIIAAITVAATIIIPQDGELRSSIIGLPNHANFLREHIIFAGISVLLGVMLAVSGLSFFGHITRTRSALALMISSIALDIVSILGMVL